MNVRDTGFWEIVRELSNGKEAEGRGGGGAVAVADWTIDHTREEVQVRDVGKQPFADKVKAKGEERLVRHFSAIDRLHCDE
jgi:hypothetical protein